MTQRTAPEFHRDVSNESMECLMDFVMHYVFEIEQELRAGNRLTGHQKAQHALLRRMLTDLGLPSEAIYIDPREYRERT